MFKTRPTTAILAAILSCAVAGCSSGSTDSGSSVTVAAPSDNGSSTAAAGSTDGSRAVATSPTATGSLSPSQAAGLLAHVPSSLASRCTGTGTNGHLPAVSGYSDSVSCAQGLSMMRIDGGRGQT